MGRMLSEKHNIPQSQHISTTRIHCLVLLCCLRDHVPFVVLPENMESGSCSGLHSILLVQIYLVLRRTCRRTKNAWTTSKPTSCFCVRSCFWKASEWVKLTGTVDFHCIIPIIYYLSTFMWSHGISELAFEDYIEPLRAGIKLFMQGRHSPKETWQVQIVWLYVFFVFSQSCSVTFGGVQPSVVHS